MAAIRATRLTQVIGVSEIGADEGHAVLAVAYSDNQIAVYDSNHPGKWKAIDYVFNPADKPAWEYKKDDAWVGYGTKHAINIFGDWQPAERFSSILSDAEAKFNGQSQTKVEITSHENGSTVENPDITVEGRILSGQVLISEVEVWVEYETSGGESARQTFSVSEDDKSFSVQLKMLDGKNRLRFTTRGRTIVNSGLADIRNDLETDADKFVLNYGIQPGQSTFTLDFNSVYVGGLAFRVTGDTSLTLNEDGSDMTTYNMNGTARISPTTFTYVDRPCSIDQPELAVADMSAVTVLKGATPALQWYYSAQFEATCLDLPPIAIIVDFRTATGQSCMTPDSVPLTNPQSSDGTYVCSCGLAALQPTTATWKFDLDL